MGGIGNPLTASIALYQAIVGGECAFSHKGDGRNMAGILNRRTGVLRYTRGDPPYSFRSVAVRFSCARIRWDKLFPTARSIFIT